MRTPRNLLANLQIVEYLRAFLGGRIGWSKSGMLLIISGAFGLFRRDVCVEVGGYDPTTVGEDAELVLRLHRHQRDRGKPCRITFFPDPICWTECPEDLRTLVPPARPLAARPDRDDRAATGRCCCAPATAGSAASRCPTSSSSSCSARRSSASATPSSCLSLALGLVSVPFALAFFAVSLVYGLVLSFLVILMEERAFRRYPGWSDLTRLTLCAVVENLGYRQLLALVRMRSWYTLLRRKQHWGEMTRTGLKPPAPLPEHRFPPRRAAPSPAAWRV